MTTLARALRGAPILLLLAVATACGSSQGVPTPAAQSLVGSAAPDLSGDSLVGDGQLDLASMTGKPTVVVFWLPSCPHCQETMPALDAAWPQVEDRANVLTVGLSQADTGSSPQEGFESPEAFVETTGLSLPTIVADAATETERWRIESVPTVYLLDAGHVIRSVLIGPGASDIVEALSSME
jgi:thiol-disulfide isomerase/thioredoxin